MLAHATAGELHGLQGPPPHPTHAVWCASPTLLRVRNRPVPSEAAVMNLKN